jgi:hypothetical protein
MDPKKVWTFCNCERVQKTANGKFVKILTSQLIALAHLLDITIIPLDRGCPSCRREISKQEAA